MKLKHVRIAAVLTICVFLGIAWSVQQLPARLSDEEFWKLITDFSEPGGTFISDNFVSNELALQDVLNNLTADREPGGVYMGVGPEQNFTFIAALRPKMAFIVDIRRQNMIEQLVYKALFEISKDRAEFLSRLLSRPRPADLSSDATVDALFEAFHEAPEDSVMYQETLDAVIEQLVTKHGFALSSDDEISIKTILMAFYIAGSRLTYAGPRVINTVMPSYEQLMRDIDKDGVQRSYLANEENYLQLQQFERDNVIVPVVGDFAGPKAIQAVGAYLKSHNATVTAFYTSNVEQYLFLTEAWKQFYANIAALPLDSKSVFVRPLMSTGSGEYAASPQLRAGMPFWWEFKLFPMIDLVDAFNAGRIVTYYDVIENRN
jgi:hypothetical protein